MATYPNIKFYRKDVAPSSPKDGYIWFDTSTKRLKIYKTNGWEDYTGVSDARYENNKLYITKIAASGSGIETIEIDLTGLTNVEQKITNAINLLDATVRSNGTTALTVPSNKHVAVEVVEQNGKLTSVSVLENDIASASTLSTLTNTVSDLSDAIDVIKGEDTGSIRDVAIDVLTETLVDKNAAEAYNELKEISAWIKQHPQEAATMNSDIATLKANVQTLQNKTAVDSFGGKTGVITLKSNSTTNGTVNFTMNNNELTGTVYGLKALAYKDSLGKSDVGLSNVTNLAASDYLTDLSSNTTNAVSITVGGTTKNITASTMKTSLGLGSAAYTASTAYATAAQGTLAASALQKVSTTSSFLTIGTKSKDADDSNKYYQSVDLTMGTFGGANGLATTTTTAAYVNTYVDTVFSWAEY